MDSAMRRICSAASVGFLTVSSSDPVRTSLRSMVADDDFAGALSAAGRVLCASRNPAVGTDTGADTCKAPLADCSSAYMWPADDRADSSAWRAKAAWCDISAALRLRRRLGI